MSKEYNRAQDQRFMARASRIAKSFLRYDSAPDPKAIERIARRIKKNRKPCSCSMCCNPRHEWGDLTMQERKALDSHHQQTNETEL